MGLSVKKGTITARTSTGSQAYTGIGFQPKVILFWGTLATADGAVTPGSNWAGVACDNAGTIQQWSIAYGGNHAAASTNEASYTSVTSAITIWPSGLSTATSMTGQAAVTAFGVDGFTLNWTDLAPAAYVIHYLAIGGTDITDCAAGSTLSASAAGNQDFTTGIGFQPSFVLMANHQGNAGVRTAGGINLGMAADHGGSIGQFAYGFNTTDGAAAAAVAGGFDTANVVASPSTTGVWNWRGSLTAFLATGFRVNWTTAAAARPMLWLAIAGINARVGNDTMKTGTTGAKDTTPTLTGLTPKAVLLASLGQPAGASYPDTTSADLVKLSQGAFTAADEGGIWFGNDDLADPTSVRARSSTTQTLVQDDFAGTTVVAADGSLLSNGFRLTYTTVKASQADVLGYAVFAEATVATSRLKRWDGSAWVVANLKKHNGSIWVPANLKKF
jgi:hypothetical protein